MDRLISIINLKLADLEQAKKNLPGKSKSSTSRRILGAKTIVLKEILTAYENSNKA